ncbi:MAG TPA: alpha/beta hydrolase [Acidimicrobiales bacterium]|nr:alpha/beta hydrolase [Acidimicrobiales bacterium]
MGAVATGHGGPTAPLAVTEHGPLDGPLVVLVHGAMDRARSFRRAVERLTDLHLVTYDRRGYGGSVAAGPPTGLSQHVDDLIAVLDGRRAAVVAHSFGSHIGVLASMQRPDLVACLGLWEPPMPWMDFWPEAPKRSVERIVSAGDPASVGERGARTILGEDAWAKLSDESRALRRAEGEALVLDMAAELEPLYDWADVRVPCLIAYGAETWPWTLDAARRVAGMMACDTFVVDGATHLGHVTHPDAFADFVRRAAALAVP